VIFQEVIREGGGKGKGADRNGSIVSFPIYGLGVIQASRRVKRAAPGDILSISECGIKSYRARRRGGKGGRKRPGISSAVE